MRTYTTLGVLLFRTLQLNNELLVLNTVPLITLKMTRAPNIHFLCSELCC